MMPDFLGMVSVVIPCYNLSEHVASAINAALTQTYRKVEVIVVNDGSTDNSEEVIRQYESRITLINQENQGLSKARNAGIRSSHGEFILPLDADDWISPDYLTKTVPLMRDQQIGIVSTDMQYFGLKQDLVRTTGFTLEDEMHANQIPVCSLIRREAYNQTPGYAEVECDDWNMWIDILKKGWHVGYVPEPLFHYQIRKGSLCDQHQGRGRQEAEEIRRQHPELNWGLR